MPQMANITVKAANGTTDVVYNAMAPSSGDSTDAVWRVEGVGTTVAERPVLRVRSRDNGNRTARRVDVTLSYPHAVTLNGQPSVVNTIPVNFSVVLPKGAPVAVTDEAVAQVANLLKSTLLQEALKSGFAPS